MYTITVDNVPRRLDKKSDGKPVYNATVLIEGYDEPLLVRAAEPRGVQERMTPNHDFYARNIEIKQFTNSNKDYAVVLDKDIFEPIDHSKDTVSKVGSAGLKRKFDTIDAEPTNTRKLRSKFVPMNDVITNKLGQDTGLDFEVDDDPSGLNI